MTHTLLPVLWFQFGAFIVCFACDCERAQLQYLKHEFAHGRQCLAQVLHSLSPTIFCVANAVAHSSQFQDELCGARHAAVRSGDDKFHLEMALQGVLSLLLGQSLLCWHRDSEGHQRSLSKTFQWNCLPFHNHVSCPRDLAASSCSQQSGGSVSVLRHGCFEREDYSQWQNHSCSWGLDTDFLEAQPSLMLADQRI